MALEPKMDTSTGKSTLSWASLRKLRRELGAFQLVDIWRLLSPSTKDYTFYSTPNQSYSRLDYFLIRQKDCSLVHNLRFGIKTLSDHAPVTMDITWGHLEPRQYNWRLNEALLQNPEIDQRIREELISYFQINETPEVSPLVIWAAHKAYIRGLYIKFGSRKKREREKGNMDLLKQISDLESRHKETRAEDDLVRLTALREKYLELNMHRVKAAITRARHSYFLYGNRSSRGLARAFRHHAARNNIHPENIQ